MLYQKDELKDELSQKVKAISAKGLTKDLISLVFLMEQKNFLKKYFKII